MIHGCWQVTLYTKNCHSLIGFNAYLSLMHPDGKILFTQNFVTDDGSYPHLTLCCEIDAHVNDIIFQQSIILIWKAQPYFCKRIKKYYI
jgi:hypothetical protein